MPNTLFPAPKTNEYQWRNLYLKEYGTCTYPPPMPRHQDDVRHESPVRDPDTRTRGDDSGAGSRGSGRRGWNDVSVGEADDALNMTSRRRHLQFEQHPDSILRDSHRVSLDLRRRSSAVDLQALTDQQLFSANIFSFLNQPRKCLSPRLSTSLSSMQRRTASFDLPPILQSQKLPIDPDVTWVQTKSEGINNSPESQSALMQLQRETWHLLFDNRIMAWFEREAKECGRIAARIQRRLLEVVTWTPDQRCRVTIKTLNADDKEGPVVKPGTVCDMQTDPKEKLSEDEKLTQTLEKFAPFFAVISPPEVIQRLTGQSILAKQRGRRSAQPDVVGMPLFSQYATWRETYENRRAWNLAPCSFFVVHDVSYNYTHISALYVLLDLINNTAHTHTPNCMIFHHQHPSMADAQSRNAHVGKRNSVVRVPLCPLVMMQQLMEDMLFAYEQSTARTMLPMAVHVLDFLTDVVLDPDTASRFLSPDALRRQCSYDLDSEVGGGGGAAAAAAAASAGVNSTANIVRNGDLHQDAGVRGKAEQSSSVGKHLGTEQPQQQQQQTHEPNEDENGDDVDGVDWSVLKQLNETTFDELFTLAHWFVDAPTANSLVPPLESPSSSPLPLSKKNSVWMGLQTAAPSSHEGKKNPPVSSLPERSASPIHDTAKYIVGRPQEFDATTSLVEAITRYELQRNYFLELRTQEQEQRQRLTSSSSQKKQKRRRLTSIRGASCNELAGISDLPIGTTLLATPLVFITTYTRLHGSSWLKELLGRIFNVLRRESVLLYVNGQEIMLSPQTSLMESFSRLSLNRERSIDGAVNLGGGPIPSHQLETREAKYYRRLELLEDLICQDIQYVMEEFFSALHGNRSITRIPQNISVLLTSFCTTIHLHLLGQKVSVENVEDKPAIRVRKCLAVMRQKRVIGGAAPNVSGKRQLDSTDRLIRSLENHRLAKFILFDCWILPALNNAVAFGHLPETTSNHLLWNIDAFARYLKIIVNASLVSFDGTDMYIHTTMPPSSSPPCSGTGHSAEKRGRRQSDITASQRCNTVKLPHLINGVFDVATGSLMQLFRKPELIDDDPLENFTFGDSVSLNGTMTGRGSSVEASSPSQDARKPWRDLSGALSSLNDSLGLTAGDPEGEETYEDDDVITPVHILNMFCAQASCDVSAKALVSEYAVPPSTAASCVAEAFSLMSGEHPIVKNASLSGILVGQFKSSPYLTCLIGVLLHPRTVSVVLDNVFQNSRAFFNALMKPLQDENILSLMSSLVVARKHLPLVNSNELLSLIAAVPVQIKAAGNKDDEGMKKNSGTQIAVWETTTRRLMRQLAQVTTGAALPRDTILHPLLRRHAPTNPQAMLQNTARAIEREAGQTPLCFDTWWRAMVVALAVKAMNVIDECSDAKSSQWEKWCHTKIHEMQREYRGLCLYFTQHKGGPLDISKAKVLAYTRSKRRNLSLASLAPSTSASFLLLEHSAKRRASRAKRRSKVMEKMDD